MANFSCKNKENQFGKMRRSHQQRKLHYRNLMSQVEDIIETEDVGLTTVNHLGAVLREVNALNNECNIDERVEHADETLLDCLVISCTSSLLKKCSEVIDVFTSVYEQSEFSDKIINYIKDPESDEIEPENLLKLLKDARMIIPSVPSPKNVYGSYDLNKVPQPKEKKERIKQKKEKFQKKEPERITSLDKEEEGIEETVKVLFDVLKEKYIQNDQQPIKYYDYIIDTDDFANTIENMFYFAFLIRDGRAELDLNSQGNPIIRPIPKDGLKQFRASNGINTQVITYITMEQWKKHKRPGFIQQRKAQSTK